MGVEDLRVCESGGLRVCGSGGFEGAWEWRI